MSERDRSIEAFLRDDGWVRALARRLASDPRDAEDVAQEAWVAMLNRATPPRRMKAWLTGTVRNVVRSGQRGDARRRDRERCSARPERLPSVEDVADREETRRRLVDAVFSLDEPYRTAVLCRYFEDWSTKAIAEHQGTSVAAIEKRLSRAIGQLRGRLANELGGSERGRAALGALAGLSVRPEPVATGAAWVPGLVTMSTISKISVATLAICGLGVFFLLERPAHEVSPPPPVDMQAARNSSGVEEPRSVTVLSDVAASSADERGTDTYEPAEGVARPKHASSIGFRVVVRAGHEAGSPVAGAVVQTSEDGMKAETSSSTDEDGIATIALLSRGPAHVFVHSEGFAPWSKKMVVPENSDGTPTIVVLSRACGVVGRLTGASAVGHDWRGCHVWAVPRGRLTTDKAAIDRSIRGLYSQRVPATRDGRFEFTDLKSDTDYKLVAAGGGLVSDGWIQAEAGPRTIEIPMRQLFVTAVHVKSRHGEVDLPKGLWWRPGPSISVDTNTPPLSDRGLGSWVLPIAAADRFASVEAWSHLPGLRTVSWTLGDCGVERVGPRKYYATAPGHMPSSFEVWGYPATAGAWRVNAIELQPVDRLSMTKATLHLDLTDEQVKMSAAIAATQEKRLAFGILQLSPTTGVSPTIPEYHFGLFAPLRRTVDLGSLPSGDYSALLLSHGTGGVRQRDFGVVRISGEACDLRLAPPRWGVLIIRGHDELFRDQDRHVRLRLVYRQGRVSGYCRIASREPAVFFPMDAQTVRIEGLDREGNARPEWTGEVTILHDRLTEVLISRNRLDVRIGADPPPRR